MTKNSVFYEGGGRLFAWQFSNKKNKKNLKKSLMRFYFLDFFRQCGTKTHGVFLQEGVQGKGLPREALGARGGERFYSHF